MHSIPGGLCTAWKRKGYTFDISMHLLTSSLSGPFNQIWRELEVIKNFEFHYHNHVLRIEGLGNNITFWTDRKKVEEQMLAISPSDAKLTKEFLDLVFGPDLLNAASLNPPELKNFAEKLKAIPVIFPLLKIFRRYHNKTLQEFALRFTDPFLRNAVRFFIDGPGWPMPELPMYILAGFIKSSVTNAGVPLGGSQQVAFKIADLFQRLGGTINYRCRVKDLIIRDGVVKGITLENGTEYLADQVIWAADGHTLIYEILGGKYLNDSLRNRYNTWTPVKPLLHVMFGVNRDFSAEPHKILFELEKPLIIAGKETKWFCLLHHSFDPSMAPAGKSVVELWFDTDYDYWENLSHDRAKYDEEKEHITNIATAEIEKRFPGFTSQVEFTDVPTPITYKNYTGNWKGSPDGWYITNANISQMTPVISLPGLKGLHMAGQWTAPYTGTVIAALTGRHVIQMLCKSERRKFLTNHS